MLALPNTPQMPFQTLLSRYTATSADVFAFLTAAGFAGLEFDAAGKIVELTPEAETVFDIPTAAGTALSQLVYTAGKADLSRALASVMNGENERVLMEV